LRMAPAEKVIMKCSFCGHPIDPSDTEALEEGLCRICLEAARDGMGFPERED
jgi:NMD protein affecting ribosome stability and mRNA decay